MPLLPPTLANGLILLDRGAAPADTLSAAKKWAEVWWEYASGMIYLNPATLPVSKTLAVPVFTATLLPGMLPVPVPGTFLVFLELAMRAAWLTLSTPVSLLPTFTSITPALIPLAPLGIAIVPVGMVSQDKTVPRSMLAGFIHTWTITQTVIGPSGPVPML